MSTVDREAGRSSLPAVTAVLERWPVACIAATERAVTDSVERPAFPALVLVTAGPVWAQLTGAVLQRLEAGDLLLVHEPDAVTLTGSMPDGAEPPVGTNWLSGDPLRARKVVVVQLDRLGTEAGLRLLLRPTILHRESTATNVEHALCGALVEAVRAGGAAPVLNAAATAIYLQCVHRHLQSHPEEIPILGGLFDAEIGPVVAALLHEPARDWTVEGLAEVGGMSRSAFARKFRDLMGTAPIDFLVELRMWQAARQLRQGGHDLKSIARQSGYQSPAAFSVAFKRWSGSTPSDYRRGT